MIEAAMYVALGVLAAGLVALVLIPPFWRRAVRLNRRDIEMTLPMTRAEIAADKDQLRAGFAVSLRKLETTVERLETKLAAREVELGQKREIVTHLTSESSVSAQGLGVLETERDQLLTTLATRDRQLAEADEARKSAEKRIVEIEGRLDAARQQIEAVIAEREAQKLEFVARDTELGNLRGQIAAATRSAGDDVVSEMAELRTALASEQVRREAAIEQVRAAEAGRRAMDVETKAGAVAQSALREQLAEATGRIEALSARLVEAEATSMGVAVLRDEKTALQARVAALEATHLRIEASSEPSASDTAAMRRKLLEIGEAVARLAAPAALPAPSLPASEPIPALMEMSSIVSMLPAPAGVPGERSTGTIAPISLAERIRALQQTSQAG
ncbi:hypothetical protein SAMN02745157_4788 [Kaistia soli DSM 19436]|uniref:Uncharacterized protein n=1 Tax=Kaistia soli DSM 19436 TaxID=1122133 RepID=A0A1M5MHG3_9HYPH|nr:hypothetical protein [Kaistia soli]SHG76760.1 hypothetical protein SAMN02745157_4788 [Kaistia soli DSM 19436]